LGAHIPSKCVITGKCSNFTPQIKGIPEATFAMHTSTQGDITDVHSDVSQESGCTSKEQATFIKARKALMWMRTLCWKHRPKSIVVNTH